MAAYQGIGSIFISRQKHASVPMHGRLYWIRVLDAVKILKMFRFFH